ncbi:MAG: argininosuccinate lyase [Candidatus Korarchaeota archaeon]|nr:argininosuccinate lyase [Candidatus Korarchaeota archaeon]
MYRRPGLGDQPDWLTRFISSLKSDRAIFRAVVLTAYAHVFHLIERGVLPKEASSLLQRLREALDREEEILSERYEDVHEALEAWLLEREGKIAGWLAYGKSRNDQVATALRLALRWRLIGLLWEMNRLRRSLLDSAEKHLLVKIPAFTHMQPAQPTLASHYLLYLENEIFHHYRAIWNVLREIVDLCPLGSGPSAGSSVPLDRGRLAELLGFSGVESNTISATGSRTFATLSVGIVASLMATLSRVAEDLIVWSTPQFSLVEIPEEHASTSSIMPQKRNPVTLELIRAKAGTIIGSLVSLLTVVKGIPSGYDLDLQEANPHILKPVEEASESVRVMADLMRRIRFREVIIPSTLAQDVAERLVRERGITYREAHSILASALRESEWDLLQACERLGIDTPRVDEILNSRGRGAPNPDLVRRELLSRRKLLRDDVDDLTSYEEEKIRAERDLLSSDPLA